jgi:phenylpropionate dioxygenase-like ring-hydroxylating dioxygenase large terminal subunit
MTENLLTPGYFRDPERFAREVERIFERDWHLAGLTRDLSQPDDYRVVRIAGREVVLQNSAGTLHAFSNVCPHRFNALRTEASGNAPLRCGYHLWSFGADGLPSAVPHRGEIPLDACRQEGLALDRWQVATIGEFLFVNHRPQQDLAQCLGPLAETLAGLSAALGDEVWSLEQGIEADWKLILQNTVEFDHAFSVHPETFATMVERPLTIVDADAPAPHIAYRTLMRREMATKPIARRIEALFERVPLPPEKGYRHILLFPNAVIGTTDNRHIALATYQPEAAGRTRANYRVFQPGVPDLTAGEKAILSAAVAHDLGFIQRLYDEDRRICESVQRGVMSAPDQMPGVLLPGEGLVRRWQESYLRQIGEEK